MKVLLFKYSKESDMNKLIPAYDPTKIERKWQEKWDQDALYHSDIEQFPSYW